MFKYFRDLLEAVVIIGVLLKSIEEHLSRISSCVDKNEYPRMVSPRLRVDNNKY